MYTYTHVKFCNIHRSTSNVQIIICTLPGTIVTALRYDSNIALKILFLCISGTLAEYSVQTA